MEILNPYSEAEFVDDRLTAVDVKAEDDAGRTYQIEVQTRCRPHLRERMAYSCADLYQAQLQRGEDYTELRPVIAIWILDEDLFRDSAAWHHVFELWDPPRGLRLTDHLAIHTIELRKWRPGDGLIEGPNPWLYFLREARNWDDLPSSVDIAVLRKAMSVLERFSEKQEDYWRYQARQNFLREQRTMEVLLERAMAKVEEVQAEAEQARSQVEQARSQAEQAQALAERERVEKERALAELSALRAQLAAKEADRA